jgi:hypothetical protein
MTDMPDGGYTKDQLISGGFPITQFQMDEMDAFMRERFPEDYFMENWPRWIRDFVVRFFVKKYPLVTASTMLFALRSKPKQPARYLNSAIGDIHDYCQKNNLDFKAVIEFSEVDLHRELK